MPEVVKSSKDYMHTHSASFKYKSLRLTFFFVISQANRFNLVLLESRHMALEPKMSVVHKSMRQFKNSLIDNMKFKFTFEGESTYACTTFPAFGVRSVLVSRAYHQGPVVRRPISA